MADELSAGWLFMKSHASSRIAALLVVFGFTIVLAACGGGSDSTDPTATTAPDTSAAPTVPTDAAAIERGETLFVSFNCIQCHLATGSGTGPALGGIAGTERTLENGETVIADDAYLAESITDPNAKITKGYAGAIMAASMMNFSSQLDEPGTVEDLVAYIKSLPATDK